ncbi:MULTISPECIES: hypothetical protein [unclassified Algibacter]|uniref:hypothetical protein n=1 Tax=unclassified Algibacter TaxID=2615009 RepID=UPI00131BBADE|nr:MULTISPECIES: hypothetical protein [unclassified Algibacter]MCL5128399.1 hypothetical protein [Algibacter sp. L4_22]
MINYRNTFLNRNHYNEGTDLLTYGNDIKCVGVLILSSVTYGEDFNEIIRNGKNIYRIFLLYKNVMAYKNREGLQ